MTKKYQVIRPWHGVALGQVVEMDEVHPSLRSNVMPVTQAVATSDEAGDLLKAAHAEIETMRTEAQQELAQRVEETKQEAQTEADRIIADAKAEAERIVAEAKQEAGELTPATPDAATEKGGVAKKAK